MHILFTIYTVCALTRAQTILVHEKHCMHEYVCMSTCMSTFRISSGCTREHKHMSTTHNSQCTTHNAQLTTHNSQLTTHNSLLTTHNALLTTHNARRTTHNSQGLEEQQAGDVPVEDAA